MSIQTISDMTSFKWGTITAVNPLALKLDGDTDPLALIPDSLVDPLSLSVADRVRVELSLRKVVIHGVSNGGDGFGSGDIVVTARTTARSGWMLCQGQSLLRSAYPRLFAAIGTTYGAADGTHFYIPNLKGRVVVGVDSSQAEFDTLGEIGGEKTHQLSEAEMPSHRHQLTDPIIVYGIPGANEYGNFGGTDQGGYNPLTSYTGGNAAHNNLQPYAAMNYMIKI